MPAEAFGQCDGEGGTGEGAAREDEVEEKPVALVLPGCRTEVWK